MKRNSAEASLVRGVGLATITAQASPGRRNFLGDATATQQLYSQYSIKSWQRLDPDDIPFHPSHPLNFSL